MIKYQLNQEIPMFVRNSEVVEDTFKLMGEEAETAKVTYVYLRSNRGVRLLLVTGNQDKKAYEKVYKAVKAEDNGRLFLNFLSLGEGHDSNTIILSHMSAKELTEYQLKEDLKKLKGNE